LGCMSRTTGGLAPELLILHGQIRMGALLITGFLQRRFF
jgi:hypothetical protein